MIGRPDQFFCCMQGRGVGAIENPRGSQVTLTNVWNRSGRPIREYGRGDHLRSPEVPVEIHVLVLEQKRSPWPII